MQINFARHSYQNRSRPLSSQRLVNYYAELLPEDAKERLVLHGTPGLKPWTTVGNGPIRGSLGMADVLYVVSGNSVYKVARDGSAASIGNVGMSGGRVSMSTNGTQLTIVEEDSNGWVATSTSVAQITDPDFPGASTVTYLDGYTIITTADSRQFAISALDDSTDYDATDVAEAEGKPDNLVVGFADHEELWLFGSESTEVFYNSGNADFPFEAISGVFIERGCDAKFSVVAEDNTIYWLGDDLIVYRAGGYVPERVTTNAVEAAIGGYAITSDAFAFTYTQEGHKFYVLTFPSAKATWVYDISTGLWHERESYLKGRWRPESYSYCYEKHLVGDFESAALYELDLDTYTDAGEEIVGIATGAPVFFDTNRFIVDRFRVDFEAGTGITTGQGSDPQAMLQWSNDGGRTWSNELWRDIGNIGEYTDRAVWRRLGQHREFIPRITISDPVKRAIAGAHVDIRLCRS